MRFTTANTTLPTRYTFTGQYSYVSDDATDLGSAGFGLMFYNARWYDPAIGRFVSADTIVPGGAQGLDRYAYVNNNPIRFTDPSGHSPGDAFIPVFLNINLATSGMPQNYYGNYSPAQTNYTPVGKLPNGLWNLCGDISLSVIVETATGQTNTLSRIYSTRPPLAMDQHDEGTNADDLVSMALAAGSSFADAESWRTDITSADDLCDTLAGMLSQGNYLIAGVTQFKYGANLVGRGTENSVKHWVTVYGIDGEYVYIFNPYTNALQKYTWEEFYQSWTWDWVEVAPPPTPPEPNPGLSDPRKHPTPV